MVACQDALRATVHIADGEGAARYGRWVDSGAMDQPVVEQNGMSLFDFERVDTLGGTVALHVLRLDRAAKGAEQPQAVGPGNHLQAAVGLRGGVEGTPDGDQRVAVESPDGATILVPGQNRALPRRFVHDHGAKDRNRGVGSVLVRTDLQTK